MSEEVRAKVFERFYRASEGVSATYPGMGLGLYISAEIIRQHGGKIWVESSKGTGSTFCFTLPVEEG
jgi:signal transduction histidine kinase